MESFLISATSLLFILVVFGLNYLTHEHAHKFFKTDFEQKNVVLRVIYYCVFYILVPTAICYCVADTTFLESKPLDSGIFLVSMAYSLVLMKFDFFRRPFLEKA